jgi:TPR repeat protein
MKRMRAARIAMLAAAVVACWSSGIPDALAETAAAAGSQTGKQRVGEMLARGQGTARDVKRGRALVKEVAEAGKVSAYVTLGDLYARGDGGPMEPAKALSAYETAAARGDTTAMIRLGDIHFYGRFKSPSPRRALAYYRSAAAGGNPYGLYGVGKIIVDRKVPKAGSPAEGAKLLRQADEAGVSAAITVLADSYFYREVRKTGVKKALALLAAAKAKGNRSAARELVAVYRDGKRDGKVILVRRDPAKARLLFTDIAAELPEGARLRIIPPRRSSIQGD